MGSRAALSADEYLRTTFPDLDNEFRDGELQGRPSPDNLHSSTQAFLVAFFFSLRKTLHLFPRPELRLKIRSGLFLIPDVSVFHPEEPLAPVPDTPPFIVIEILSEDDRMNAVREKLQEYKAWGAPHVWLVDPYSRRVYTCNGSLHEVTALTIPELGVELKPHDIFE